MNEEEQPVKEKKYYDHISIAKRTAQAVYFVAQHDKTTMLELVLKKISDKQIVIITKSKKSADELYFHLKDIGLKAFSIHGNHKPEVVEKTALSFNNNELNILITTDMILQSLSLENIQVVINYDLPLDPANYFKSLKLVDEIGESILFVGPDDERGLTGIELMMKMEVEEQTMEEFTPTPFVQKNRNKKKKPRHKKTKNSSKTREVDSK